MRWRRGRGVRGRGRPHKPVMLRKIPQTLHFQPNPTRNPKPILLELEELEALRLVDLEGLTQEQAGTQMNISRGTIWRFIQTARRKTTKALVEARPLYIRKKE